MMVIRAGEGNSSKLCFSTHSNLLHNVEVGKQVLSHFHHSTRWNHLKVVGILNI